MAGVTLLLTLLQGAVCHGSNRKPTVLMFDVIDGGAPLIVDSEVVVRINRVSFLELATES